jgi:hypothetical protein
LAILTLAYKYNIQLINLLSKYDNYNGTVKDYIITSKLNASIIYYKSFLFSFLLVSILVNYILYVKSPNNDYNFKSLLFFGTIEFIFITIIFYKTDQHIYNLDKFINIENQQQKNNKTNSDKKNRKKNRKKNIKKNTITPQNTNFPNIDSNPDLPYKSQIWKQMRDYKTTKLPKYVKNPNKQYNKPEHYDYTPDDIPQWHLDPTLAAKFKKMKQKWENDPNRNYREQVNANDNSSVPYMEGGLDMIYPDTKVKNLFEMDRDSNKPNNIIIKALESSGYNNEYSHNTEHLRRYNSCKLNAMSHDNPTNLYFDPNNRYMHMDKFPNPKIKLCPQSKTNKVDVNKKPKYGKIDLESLSNYQNSFMKNISNEYVYSSDEINTQYLNRKGYINNKTKIKNISQHCTNYSPADNEQLRKINDNTAYSIFAGK